jgi:hypothetical protein
MADNWQLKRVTDNTDIHPTVAPRGSGDPVWLGY